jgi:hypothetical protein
MANFRDRKTTRDDILTEISMGLGVPQLKAFFQALMDAAHFGRGAPGSALDLALDDDRVTVIVLDVDSVQILGEDVQVEKAARRRPCWHGFNELGTLLRRDCLFSLIHLPSLVSRLCLGLDLGARPVSADVLAVGG